MRGTLDVLVDDPHRSVQSVVARQPAGIADTVGLVTCDLAAEKAPVTSTQRTESNAPRTQPAARRRFLTVVAGSRRMKKCPDRRESGRDRIRGDLNRRCEIRGDLPFASRPLHQLRVERLEPQS